MQSRNAIVKRNESFRAASKPSPLKSLPVLVEGRKRERRGWEKDRKRLGRVISSTEEQIEGGGFRD